MKFGTLASGNDRAHTLNKLLKLVVFLDSTKAQANSSGLMFKARVYRALTSEVLVPMAGQ